MQRGLGVKGLLILLIALSMGPEAWASRSDFKGLFGSYRREKYTENEGDDTDFGLDLGLSTLLPVSPVASSIQADSSGNVLPQAPLNYATFFNYEFSFFFTLAYNWEISAKLGYYTYSTRVQNSSQAGGTLNGGADANNPLFTQFDMTAVPILLGVKYRFSRSDIVPYIGVAAGIAYTDRKGSYDYNTQLFNHAYDTVLAAEFSAGVEFYIASRAGIRLEVGGQYFNLPSYSYDPAGTPTNFPVIIYGANPVSIRYMSGVFFLF